MNKHVAIVVNSAWAAYNFRLNLAKGIKTSGYKISFVFPFDKKYTQIIKQQFDCYHIDIDSKSINPLKDILTLFDLIKIFRKIEPSAACLFTIKPNIYGSIACQLKNVPYINNITGLGTVFIKKSFLTTTVKLFYRVSLFSSKQVFFQNKNDQNLFINNNIINHSNTSVIPGSGVDTLRFSPVEDSSNHVFVFLMIARLIKDKGIYEYINAIKSIKSKLPDAKITFQLLGELGANNRTAVSESELNQWIDDSLIEYLGTTDKVENVLAKCDCVVLPSYREGMPRSVLEGFAMSKPAIVSDVAGCRDIVDDQKDGMVCQPKSSSDLAKKMLEMYFMEKTDRVAMGVSGRKKVENFFDERIVIKTYLDTIDRIIKYEENI